MINDKIKISARLFLDWYLNLTNKTKIIIFFQFLCFEETGQIILVSLLKQSKKYVGGNLVRSSVSLLLLFKSGNFFLFSLKYLVQCFFALGPVACAS